MKIWFNNHKETIAIAFSLIGLFLASTCVLHNKREAKLIAENEAKWLRKFEA